VTRDPIAAIPGGRALVVLATGGAVAFGALSLESLPRGIYPEVDFPRIVVVARAGDLPPPVMVAAATRPLEESIATVPGVERLRSRTIRGATELSAQLAPGTDMFRALQLVQAHVDEARRDLPERAEVTVERVTATALPIATFNIGGAADDRVLRDVGDRILRPALTRVAGIGAVEVQGGDVREIEVLLRPQALAGLHLTPSGVADSLAEQDVVAAVGRVSDLHESLTVMASSEATTADAIAALPIAIGPHGPVPLSAVADVVEGAEDRTVSTTGPGGDIVVVSVSRAPGASAPQVVDDAHATVDALRRAHAFPPGVRVETVYDQSELVRDSMRGVRDAILLGILLSLIVLALFLRDVRAGAAAAIAVPVTLIATFGVAKLAGQSLDLMSLGGLAISIGLVIDDAIVIVEAIVRRREEGMAVREAAVQGTRDLFAAVVGTTLTTVIVFVPLALIAGVVGRFFSALAVTLCAAVLLSLVVSVTLVPLVASRLLAKTAKVRASPDRLARGYGRLVIWLSRRPVVGVVTGVLLAAAGVLGLSRLGTGFLPTMDEGAFVLDFALPPGTSLEETDHVARRIDRVLAATPGIVSFTRRTGSEMGPATATLQNTGDILARLAPRDRRPDIDDMIARVRDRVAAEVPEASIEFVQVLQDVLGDLEGNPRPIEVRVFGEDPAVLDTLGAEVSARLERLPELVDVTPGVEGQVPILEASVRPAAAAGLGVTPAQVARDLGVALAGRVVTTARVSDRLIGVRVRMPDAVRFDPAAVATLPLAYGTTSVGLDAVAALSRPRGPAVLHRENLRSMILVSTAVRGSDLGGATAAVERAMARLHFPAGYTYEIGGQAEAARQTQRDLAGVAVLGLFLVLGILLVQLRLLRLALVVLVCAPLALVGAVWTLVATGIPLNASSLIGCILLVGLVVKNGILLLEHARRLEPTSASFSEAIAAAGERRLRPILMTTAATLAGLIPLALGFGAGSELQRPLAVATIGGLVLSTFVTLLALPALACAVMRKYSVRATES